MLLAGKTALITGGAVRVGAALSRGLAAAGARVVIHYHASDAEAQALAGEIGSSGGESVAIRADLSVHAEVERLAAQAEGAFGGVDVLINNASIFPEAALAEVDEALWERTLAVNLKAPFFLTQRLGAAMKARGGGVIVNLGDLAGIQAWKGYAAHSVSKAALLHLTRVSARALAPEVRVNAIAPGTVLPPEDFPAAEVEALARRAPLARNGSPDDVVAAALYLIGADFVTGETLVLDGGRSLT
jgi:NAD(P)-dependent dehydrogenase (short-subunit alcohol dehydrogenase family)